MSFLDIWKINLEAFLQESGLLTEKEAFVLMPYVTAILVTG